VTGAGTWLDQLTRDSFASVMLQSTPEALDGTGRPPTTELQLHLETYRVRPDVNAIVHLHPQTTVLLDLLGEPVRLLTTDHAFYVRKVVSTPFAPPGSRELAASAAEAVADGTNCVILAHHGCSVLGETVEMAHRRAVNLEEAARMTYRALVLSSALAGPRGSPREIPECPSEALYSNNYAM
jgi:L-fuculose-phosphate aldolase